MFKGLVPTKQTCKFTPANPKKKFQPTRLREWAEHAIALSTLLSTYFSRAWIHTEIKDSNEKPKAGRLIIELDKDHLQYYTKYLKVLQRGKIRFQVVHVHTIMLQKIMPDFILDTNFVYFYNRPIHTYFFLKHILGVKLVRKY